MQEILIRLRTLYEESGNAVALRGYDEKLDEVNKRIGLLAQYAPHGFWALREAYAKRFDPTKPFPEFNEAFADDWPGIQQPLEILGGQVNTDEKQVRPHRRNL